MNNALFQAHSQEGGMFMAKRVYAPAAPEDGFRVLTDRLWPRGLTKEAAAVDLWLKEIAPSTELRNWFKHEAPLWPEFQVRYRLELQTPERQAALAELLRLEQEHGTVTLLFAVREEVQNHTQVLMAELKDKA